MLKKITIALIAAFIFAVMQSQPSYACGGLIARDGNVRLDRAKTLVAWHDGIEHYMTGFAYQGEASDIGWIVPLPANPDKIEAGGQWTFTRLERVVKPPVVTFNKSEAPSAAGASDAQVLQEVKVETLDIKVVQGSGQAILDWGKENGFDLDFETRAHLLEYAKGTPIFMAAKYDVAAAKAKKQIKGNGVPLLLTMKTPHPWVPLEILAVGTERVEADLYFLTDQPINISDVNAKIGQSAVDKEVPDAKGFKVAYQAKMNEALYKDLSTDRNMSWVPRDSWLTYMTLDAPSRQVTYDLTINEAGIIRLASYGQTATSIIQQARTQELPGWLPNLPMGTPQWLLGGLAIGAFVGAVLFWRARERKRTRSSLQ
jgi:hypothetical protein